MNSNLILPMSTFLQRIHPDAVKSNSVAAAIGGVFAFGLYKVWRGQIEDRKKNSEAIQRLEKSVANFTNVLQLQNASAHVPRSDAGQSMDVRSLFEGFSDSAEKEREERTELYRQLHLYLNERRMEGLIQQNPELRQQIVNYYQAKNALNEEGRREPDK